MDQNPSFSTRVIEISTPDAFERAVQEAVSQIESGQVVALPTETVYGLAADGWNANAVDSIFKIKGRPSHNPVILHVSSYKMLQSCVTHVPEEVRVLGSAFWPGPLTIVLPKSTLVPDIVTASGPTVAIRWPGHPFMREVITRLDRPLAAPSANPSNGLSPSLAQHVVSSLNGRVPLIVDGGLCSVGIESTVIDLSGEKPRLLRPGIISPEDLKQYLPNLEWEKSQEPKESGGLKSPGQLKKHYAPNTPLFLFNYSTEHDLLNQVNQLGGIPEKTFVFSHNLHRISDSWENYILIPDDPEAYARALYLQLHEADESPAKPTLILVEWPPDTPEWLGIRDRLQRAAFKK